MCWNFNKNRGKHFYGRAVNILYDAQFHASKSALDRPDFKKLHSLEEFFFFCKHSLEEFNYWLEEFFFFKSESLIAETDGRE